MKASQVAVFAGVLIVCAVGLVWAFAPPERLASIKAALLPSSHAEKCLEYVRDNAGLKDPASAQLVSSTESPGTVNIRFKAKNSFGAYVSSEYECSTIGKSVGASAGQLMKDLDAIGVGR